MSSIHLPAEAENDSPLSDHILKQLLDSGFLKLRNPDREFTKAIDLKQKYHTEFIKRVIEHAKLSSSWEDLQDEEAARRRCAESFVRHYGPIYWGTEKNRRKYLMEESLQEPKELCTYPERREEIIRIVVLLLLKKATKEKSRSTPATVGTGEGEGEVEEEAEEPGDESLVIPPPPSERPFARRKRQSNPPSEAEIDSDYEGLLSTFTKKTEPKAAKKPEHPAKKTARRTRELEPVMGDEIGFTKEPEPKAAKKPQHPVKKTARNARPSEQAMDDEFALVADGEPKAAKKPGHPAKKTRKVRWSELATDDDMVDTPSISQRPRPSYNPVVAPDEPKKVSPTLQAVINGGNNNNNSPKPTDTTTACDTQLTEAEAEQTWPQKTIFLLSLATAVQKGLAPIHIPFEPFTSSSAFIERMAHECGLNNNRWSSGAQLNAEMNNNGGEVVASVKFGWSDFWIRVRPGRDTDWALVMQELNREWKSQSPGQSQSQKGVDDEPRKLLVHVMVHVVG